MDAAVKMKFNLEGRLYGGQIFTYWLAQFGKALISVPILSFFQYLFQMNPMFAPSHPD